MPRKARQKPSILVCNDDGIYGPGLPPLAAALGPLGRVTVVVPEQERSAISHAITLHKPIRVRRVKTNTYIINGTPADCVRFGVLSLMKNRADIVVSGINKGPNLGVDTVYSGTLGAAREACVLGLQSVAVSLVDEGKGCFATAARFTRVLVRRLLQHPLPPQTCLNVNVPDRPPARVRGVAVTHLGKRRYGKELTSRVDPRGQNYYWLAGETPTGIASPGSDVGAVEGGVISVTPISLDMTAHGQIAALKQWSRGGFRGKV